MKKDTEAWRLRFEACTTEDQTLEVQNEWDKMLERRARKAERNVKAPLLPGNENLFGRREPPKHVSQERQPQSARLEGATPPPAPSFFGGGEVDDCDRTNGLEENPIADSIDAGSLFEASLPVGSPVGRQPDQDDEFFAVTGVGVISTGKRSEGGLASSESPNTPGRKNLNSLLDLDVPSSSRDKTPARVADAGLFD